MLRLKRTPIHTFTDPDFEGFEVKLTKRGWWSDIAKVQAIIDSAKAGETQCKAQKRAQISKKQWMRFNDVHPTFRSVWYKCVDRVKYPRYERDWLTPIPQEILDKYECKPEHYCGNVIMLIPKKIPLQTTS
jgi:hypothetical protein